MKSTAIRRVVSFKDDREKLAFMNDIARKGALDPRIIELGTELVRYRRPDDWIGMATEIHRFVREAIRYQHDPARREQLADPWSVLERGADDCDGKAVLATALYLAVGIEARVKPVWRGSMLAHVQSEARWPGSERVRGATEEGWVVSELTIAGCELGQDPRSVPRDPETGRLPLS